LISGIASLPSAPSAYLKLVEALRSPEVTTEEIASVLMRDVGMTAKILQLVNSAAFGCRRHITNLEDAVIFLGIDSIKAMALSVSAFSMFTTGRCVHFSIGSFQEHSAAVAALARAIAKSRNAPKLVVDDAFVAGLVHDVGELILVSSYPEKYDRVLEEVAKGNKPIEQVEQEVFGTTHAEAGGYLLSLWGLPDSVVEAVAFHHNPSKCPDTEFGPLTAVHVADVLEHEKTNATTAMHSTFDTAYLNRIKVVEELPAWSSLAEELASK
jgi:HD-like signal output (HDOD) protein